MSAFTLFETRVVLNKYVGGLAMPRLSRILDDAKIGIFAFDEGQSALAFEAYRRWGKGNHPAALNLGDCAAYALAKSLGAPLLYKSGDFTQTDIVSAL